MSNLINNDKYDFESQFKLTNSKISSISKKQLYSFSDDEIKLNTEKREYIANPDYEINAALNVKELTNEEINTIASSILREKQQNERTLVFNQDLSSSSLSSDDETKAAQSTMQKIITSAEDALGESVGAIRDYITDVFDYADLYVSGVVDNENYSSSVRTLSNIASKILSIISQNLKDYQDGISETSFGAKMEESWYGNTQSSFLNYFKSKNTGSQKINLLKSTPLDAGSERTAIYGSMILGTPFLFNSHADPDNRVLINTLVKDGKILSLTPGMPKFNGTSYDIYGSSYNNLMNQTKEPTAMLSYLTKNGLDSDFANKDKRYYTFKTDYEMYFSYLETMLNAIWIKMGLAKNGNEFNIFSFFDIKKNSGIDPNGYGKLLSQYNSSIGFFTNIAGAVSESIDSQKTSFGSELAGNANNKSDAYQRLNYIHGMGTGTGVHNAMRTAGTIIQSGEDFSSFLNNTFSRAQSAWSNTSGILKKIVKTVAAGVIDITHLATSEDLGSVIQSFAVSNGMKVVYPDLWSDSDYSKNMNFNFTFISPYGDPLSIFKYVYVPFCALACFALPRQAAENGYVSPFFIRADVPGVITSDLAMISSFTWTKGGGNNLWTKDGLPRSIEVSISITDLYPYLAMTKRLSFLSANPSYAVFLDNLSGMMSLTDGSTDDNLNQYFSKLINRVNGLSQDGTNMWNKFNSTKNKVVKQISEEARNSISGTLISNSIPWLHNSSIT